MDNRPIGECYTLPTYSHLSIDERKRILLHYLDHVTTDLDPYRWFIDTAIPQNVYDNTSFRVKAFIDFWNDDVMRINNAKRTLSNLFESKLLILCKDMECPSNYTQYILSIYTVTSMALFNPTQRKIIVGLGSKELDDVLHIFASSSHQVTNDNNEYPW